MKVSFSTSALKDLRKLEGKLTRDIKTAALRAGWGKDLANKLKVRVLSDEIVVQYPDSVADAIEDLEYGTKRTNPKPVFRTFMKNHTEELIDILDEWAMKALVEREMS